MILICNYMNEGSTNYAKNKELFLIRKIFNFYSLFNCKLSITNRDTELQGETNLVILIFLKFLIYFPNFLWFLWQVGGLISIRMSVILTRTSVHTTRKSVIFTHTSVIWHVWVWLWHSRVLIRHARVLFQHAACDVKTNYN
jgi:hypothetical protein